MAKFPLALAALLLLTGQSPVPSPPAGPTSPQAGPLPHPTTAPPEPESVSDDAGALFAVSAVASPQAGTLPGAPAAPCGQPGQ